MGEGQAQALIAEHGPERVVANIAHLRASGRALTAPRVITAVRQDWCGEALRAEAIAAATPLADSTDDARNLVDRLPADRLAVQRWFQLADAADVEHTLIASVGSLADLDERVKAVAQARRAPRQVVNEWTLSVAGVLRDHPTPDDRRRVAAAVLRSVDEHVRAFQEQERLTREALDLASRLGDERVREVMRAVADAHPEVRAVLNGSLARHLDRRPLQAVRACPSQFIEHARSLEAV